jgi:hypothetical protein
MPHHPPYQQEKTRKNSFFDQGVLRSGPEKMVERSWISSKTRPGNLLHRSN